MNLSKLTRKNRNHRRVIDPNFEGSIGLLGDAMAAGVFEGRTNVRDLGLQTSCSGCGFHFEAMTLKKGVIPIVTKLR